MREATSYLLHSLIPDVALELTYELKEVLSEMKGRKETICSLHVGALEQAGVHAFVWAGTSG